MAGLLKGGLICAAGIFAAIAGLGLTQNPPLVLAIGLIAAIVMASVWPKQAESRQLIEPLESVEFTPPRPQRVRERFPDPANIKRPPRGERPKLRVVK